MTEEIETTEAADGPTELPTLPLRNSVLFPQVVIPLAVGRDKSIAMDLSLPTASGMTTCGKSTLFLSGRVGSSVGPSAASVVSISSVISFS